MITHCITLNREGGGGVPCSLGYPHISVTMKCVTRRKETFIHEYCYLPSEKAAHTHTHAHPNANSNYNLHKSLKYNSDIAGLS